MEKENKNNPVQPQAPISVTEEAAALQALIEADYADLDQLIDEGQVSKEEESAFRAEIDEKTMLLGFFQQTLDELRDKTGERLDEPATEETNDKDKKTAEVDFSKIGWVSSKDTVTKHIEKTGRPETPVYFGSIVEEDRVTKAVADKLVASGEWDTLIEKLKTDTLPQLWNGIVGGRGNVRPISAGTRSPKEVKAQTSLKTQYPAYKVDVHGTNNRAIVLITSKIDGNPVFMLAAMYDHDDQQQVIKHTFQKTRKGAS